MKRSTTCRAREPIRTSSSFMNCIAMIDNHPFLFGGCYAEALSLPRHSGAVGGARAGGAARANSWRLGWAASLDATGWINDYVGIRATGGWAQDSLDGTAAGLVGRGKFNKFTYDADLVLRYPIKSGSGWILPYVLGGAGAISIHQLEAADTWTKFAGNFGAGLEYRFGRAGVRAEARDNVYKLDRYGFDKTQHDIAWQGGVTLSF